MTLLFLRVLPFFSLDRYGAHTLARSSRMNERRKTETIIIISE
jgi:hypothetical protein